MNKLVKLITRLAVGSSYLSFLAVILMMLVVSSDVIMTIFKHPLKGNMEIVVVLMVCVVFFGQGLSSIEDEQIRIDIFKKWPVLDHISNVVVMGLGLALGWQAAKAALSSFKIMEASQQLGIPNWPFQLVVAFGFFMLFLAVGVLEYKKVKRVSSEKGALK